MRIDYDDFTNFASIAGIYPSDYDDVFAEVCNLEPGMAFIDIGAGHGVFSLVAGKQVDVDGVILAFEPNLRSFTFLVSNAVKNRLSSFYPFNAAVGRRTGVANLEPGPESHSGIGQLAPNGTVRVLLINFTDYQRQFDELLGSRRIVVKIDVEGHEAHVLTSMLNLLQRPSVEKVIVEVDEQNLRQHGSTAMEIYGIMKGAGFRDRRGLGAARHYNEVFVRDHIDEAPRQCITR